MLPSSSQFFSVVMFQFQWMTIFCESPLVLTFRPNATNSPRARVFTTFAGIREFTICFSYRPLRKATEYNVVLDYEVPDSDKNELLIYIPKLSQICIITRNPSRGDKCFPHDVPLRKWLHICLVWSSYDAKLYLFIGGQISGSPRGFRRNSAFVNGELYIGADQTSFGSNKFPIDQSSFGAISKMHIWDRRLCFSEIQKIASCNSTLKGNVMSWGETRTKLVDNVDIGTDPDICVPCD